MVRRGTVKLAKSETYSETNDNEKNIEKEPSRFIEMITVK